MWSSLELALRLLTAIPVRSFPERRAGESRRAIVFFPLVGALIGSLAGMVWFVAARVWTDPQSLVPAILSAIAGLLVTGARGIMGAARTADGLASLADGDRARAAALIRDPHRGAAGVVTAAAGIVLRVALYSALPRDHAWQAIVVSSVGGRWASSLCFAVFPFAAGWQSEDIGRGLESAGMSEFVLASCVAIVCAALWPVHGIYGLVAAAILAMPAAQAINRALGGFSAPVAFGIGELGEVAALLVYSIP
jgi:adenosylcobinamide-GDP ribazoletransferase